MAGHTYGGQVCLPGYGSLRTATRPPRSSPTASPRCTAATHVKGGVGTTALPIRFARPPEIALLTLSAPSTISA